MPLKYCYVLARYFAICFVLLNIVPLGVLNAANVTFVDNLTDTVVSRETSNTSCFRALAHGQYKPFAKKRFTVSPESDAVNQVHAYIHFNRSPFEQIISEIKRYGITIELVDVEHRIIQAWISPETVFELRALPFVSGVTSPDYTIAQSGAITTEGDVALGAEALRQTGHTGEGVNVGVISIGVDNLAVSQAWGELPYVEIINAASGTGNEGTALLEIVYDLAPGCNLAFCEARTSLELVTCVNELKNSFLADIIVDDLAAYREPYFEDGPVAKTVKRAVDAGILYASSAGNSAGRHYEKDYVATETSSYGLHDFGVANGMAPDTDMDIEVGAGAAVLITLQWNDLFGASGNDYDLILRDEYGSLIGVSAESQDGDDNPLESIAIINLTASDATAKVMVEKYHGQPKRLEMYFWALRSTDLTLLEYNVAAGSVFGHASVPGVLAVGAIDVSDPGLDTIEPFSSRGPAEIYFPRYESRKKPDLAATDGVSVSSASGFPSPFYGTSAAVPHVAGIGALLMSAHPNASAKQITMALRKSAQDLGETGYDFVYGNGLVDAMAADEIFNVPDTDVPHLGGLAAILTRYNTSLFE